MSKKELIDSYNFYSSQIADNKKKLTSSEQSRNATKELLQVTNPILANMENALEEKHELIASVIKSPQQRDSSSLQWYEDLDILALVAECAYEELTDDFFSHRSAKRVGNKLYVGQSNMHVINAFNKFFHDISKGSTWDESLFYWNYLGNGLYAPTPTVYLDSAENEQKIKEAACDLDNYISSLHTAREKFCNSQQARELENIRIQVDSFSGKYAGHVIITSPEPGKYDIRQEEHPSRSNADNCYKSLEEILYDIREDYWLTDFEDIYEVRTREDYNETKSPSGKAFTKNTEKTMENLSGRKFCGIPVIGIITNPGGKATKNIPPQPYLKNPPVSDWRKGETSYLYNNKGSRGFSTRNGNDLLSVNDLVDMISSIAELIRMPGYVSLPLKASGAEIDFNKKAATVVFDNKEKISAQIFSIELEDNGLGGHHFYNEIDKIVFKLEGKTDKEVAVHFSSAETNRESLAKLENAIAELMLDSIRLC